MHTPSQKQAVAPPSNENHGVKLTAAPDGPKSQESADLQLSQGALPSRALHGVSIQGMFADLANRLPVGNVRSEVMDRAEGLRTPIDPEFDTKIASATAKFEQLDVTHQNEIFRRFFKPNVCKRAAWTMPSYPIFFSPELEMVKEAHAKNMKIAQSLLTTGLLPQEDALRAAQAVGAAIPNYRGKATFIVASMMSAVVISSAFVAPPWVTAVAVIGGFLFCRGFANRPNIHVEYAAGYVTETLDAFSRLQSGGLQSIKSTLDYYFNDPEFPDAYQNGARADGFLIARTLRLLGHSNTEMLQAFQDPRTVNMPNNELVPTVSHALQEQELVLENPLVSAFMNSESPENEPVVALLETMNAAHFAWGARDKENLRLQLAEQILTYDV
jgi:hypothetical protein